MKRWSLGLAGVALLAGAAAVGAQEVYEITGSDVAVYNLAGKVEVVRGGGSDVVVHVLRGGDDAERLSVETGQVRGGRTALRVIYPGDRIVYPDMGRGSHTGIRVRSDGTFGDRGGNRGDRVDIRGSGRGLEAWADLRIEVPAGQKFSVYLATGGAEARGIDGDVRLDIGSGEVVAQDMSGVLVVDTGSGSVSVVGMNGPLGVDTGSGRVRVEDVAGRLSIDTGSGSVVVKGVRGAEVEVDTGSGSIELTGVASPEVIIDTGSGGIDVELLEDVETLDVDTGSGSVTVYAPPSLGAALEIDTGSGGIHVDVPVEVRTVRRDRMIGTLGDGQGLVRIDTGSGTIRIVGR